MCIVDNHTTYFLPMGDANEWLAWYPPDDNEPTEEKIKEWKSEGRCPKCGALGPFCPKTLVPICPEHGPY